MNKNEKHKNNYNGFIIIFVLLITIIISNSEYGENFHYLIHNTDFLPFSIHTIIDEFLMSIFFFSVGLEIKAEIVSGQLRNLKTIILPISAALGGMFIPIFVYLIFNYNTSYSDEWAIPMATDIALALAVISIFSKKVPKSVVLFLSLLAIFDDIGGIIVIAFKYTQHVNFIFLTLGLVGGAILFIMNKRNNKNIFQYLVVGIIGVWFPLSLSNIHPTIAGVIIALSFPAQINTSNSTISLNQLKHQLDPFVNYFIIPLFILASSGILIDVDTINNLNSPLALGIILGLLIGKPIGVIIFTSLSLFFKMGKFPENMKFKHLIGIALIAGIGFTMSIFISDLSIAEIEMNNTAKISIFIGSFMSAILGITYLKLMRK